MCRIRDSVSDEKERAENAAIVGPATPQRNLVRALSVVLAESNFDAFVGFADVVGMPKRAVRGCHDDYLDFSSGNLFKLSKSLRAGGRVS